MVAATLRAVLRHAALDRLPHATSGLSQRLPRLLGQLRRALGCGLRGARQTTIPIPGRTRTGRSRPPWLVAGLPGRRTVGALLVPARPCRALSATRALVPYFLGVTRPLMPLAFRAVATRRATFRLTALRMLALRLLPLRLRALRLLALRTPRLRLRAVRMRALWVRALLLALRLLALRAPPLRLRAVPMRALWVRLVN